MKQPSKVEQVAAELWRPIPSPRPRKPKPQQSWQQLKPGQYLRSKFLIQLKGYNPGPGSLFRVLTTTDQGATLEAMECGASLVWTLMPWKHYFDRCRRPAGAPK